MTTELDSYTFHYNAHRYSDCSDIPQSRPITFKGISLELAWGAAWVWRERENERAHNCERKTFVGMIHGPTE
jgi:hypothetical protein